jgi:DNA topoisomerase-1
VKTLPVLFEIGFTAEMEKQLDAIEEGRQNWQKMLADFYANFTDWLNSAKFAGAPRSEQAEGLIAKLDTVQTWEKPVKFGRRTYNDKKFFESIKEQFAKDAAITEKQWTALLNMAVKYRDQIPGFDAFIVEFSCEKEVADLEKAAEIRSAEAEQRQANLNSDEFIKLKEAFDLFENIEWEPPVKRRGRTYDDAAFFKSLKQQLESGRKFSDKQLNAFKQLAARYVDKVSDKEKLNSLLELDKIHSANAEGNKEVEQLLASLANVKNWDDPVSKGKRTFDDKSFFESLQKQYTEKKSLSSRQIYALKKMVAKYAKK